MLSPDSTRLHSQALPAPDTTVGPGQPTDSPAAPPGSPTARYQLGEEIARGGMGAVFAARDTALNRDVAVKVLLPRRANAATVRRFVDEAHITGQLQHPGIPPVHDLGTLPDGRPFLAMKLIKGRTLDAVLQAGTDRGRLLAVFEGVCQAVGYAHAHGVIHRDLKPANVMVGAFGEVQVMDWGLAKLLATRPDAEPGADPLATTAETEIRGTHDAGDATQAGSVLGTPAFMPPEQAIGAVDQIDARSDVFGLGAILCVLLTGKPPFVGADAESTRQLAARGKVSDAFARLDACGAEPELVALGKRCLAPERDDRPKDAGAVASLVAGLRAAADDRARRAEVEAGAAVVRAAEERKRRRTLAMAGGVGLAVLLLGVVGTTAGLVQADRARQLAEAAEGREATERQTAEAKGEAAAKARDRTRQALDAMTSTVTGESLATQKEISPEQKKFLAEVLVYYREFAGERGDDETSRARAAAAAARVGAIEEQLGRTAEAVAAYTQARDGWAALAADFPAEPAHRSELARSLYRLGGLLGELGERAKAVEAHRAALAVSQRLAADHPAAPQHRHALAACHFGLGNLLAAQARWAEAEQAYQTALDVGRALAADFPATPAYRHTLADTHVGVGNLSANRRRPGEAEPAYRAALTIYRALAADFPRSSQYRYSVVCVHNNLAAALDRLGKSAEAETEVGAALALNQALVAEFPARPEYRVALGGGCCNMAVTCTTKGQLPEAIDWFARAVAALQPVVAADPRQVTPKRFLRNSHAGRAVALDRLARFAEAVPDWDRAIELDDGSTRAAFRASRTTSRLRAGQVAEAVAEVAELTQSPKWAAGRWYDFACVYAVGSGKLADKREEYAARAVALLGKAVAAGWADAAHMSQDRDLDPLRDRPDFRRLVAALAAKTTPGEVAPPPRPVR